MIILTRYGIRECQDEHASNVDQEGMGGGAGGPNPMNDQKNIGFLSKAGPDPMKNHRAAEPTFIVGSSSTRQ